MLTYLNWEGEREGQGKERESGFLGIFPLLKVFLVCVWEQLRTNLGTPDMDK